VVVAAVQIEPVSKPSNSTNSEINREFGRIRPSFAIFLPDRRPGSIVYAKIPCGTEQGISKAYQGIFSRNR
jgi:hypothetical protein